MRDLKIRTILVLFAVLLSGIVAEARLFYAHQDTIHLAGTEGKYTCWDATTGQYLKIRVFRDSKSEMWMGTTQEVRDCRVHAKMKDKDTVVAMTDCCGINVKRTVKFKSPEQFWRTK